MKSPSFQFYPDNFIEGTFDMTDAEVGLYMRLLCAQWSRGALPNDDKGLLRFSRGGTARTLSCVKAKFVLGDDGMLRNQKLEKVRADLATFRARQAVNGMKGGRPKPKPNPDETQALTQTHSQTEPKKTPPTPTPSPTPPKGEGKPPSSASPPTGTGVSASTRAIMNEKELERVEKRMAAIRAGYSDSQGWSEADVAEHKTLKLRKKELLCDLGFKV